MKCVESVDYIASKFKKKSGWWYIYHSLFGRDILQHQRLFTEFGIRGSICEVVTRSATFGEKSRETFAALFRFSYFFGSVTFSVPTTFRVSYFSAQFMLHL